MPAHTMRTGTGKALTTKCGAPAPKMDTNAHSTVCAAAAAAVVR